VALVVEGFGVWVASPFPAPKRSRGLMSFVSVIEGTAVARILVGAAESDPELTRTYAAADYQTA
jgi:hypothetical protein